MDVKNNQAFSLKYCHLPLLLLHVMTAGLISQRIFLSTLHWYLTSFIVFWCYKWPLLMLMAQSNTVASVLGNNSFRIKFLITSDEKPCQCVLHLHQMERGWTNIRLYHNLWRDWIKAKIVFWLNQWRVAPWWACINISTARRGVSCASDAASSILYQCV